ncbi:MAG: hypothetical protein ATN34_01160 [Epulopiscium sp. Nele67-Bin002]|nr:MAG: hypothetical protein ATN34_01160 [Epulopiscium sp. Nele67-Bin002]
MSNMGFEIMPEIRSFSTFLKFGLATIIEEISQIPNLSYISFDGSSIAGYTEEQIINLVKNYGFINLEFYTSTNQEGFVTLANRIEDNGTYNIVRMFSPEKMSHLKAYGISDTYELALTERSVRLFGFVLPQTGNIHHDFELLCNEIETFVDYATNNGFHIGTNIRLQEWPNPSRLLLFVIGLGAVAMFVKLVSLTPFRALGPLAGILGTLAFIALLLIDKVTAVRIMSLLATIVFPSYAVLIFIDPPQHSSIAKSLIDFARILIITIVGIAIMCSLISGYNFAIGLDLFLGVKLAHMAPLVIVPIVIILSRWSDIKIELRNLRRINWKLLVLFSIIGIGIIGSVLSIYIYRTGNSNSISDLEQTFRTTLDNILGVRPRTKELLIGHPLLILGLYLSYRGFRWPVLVAGTIGQVSMTNTFAHIHTPLLISIIRTGYGIIIGTVVGIIFICIYKVVYKLLMKVFDNLGWDF